MLYPNPLCIDNFQTTRKSRFMNTSTLEIDISHHQKSIGTKLRSTFTKVKPDSILYRCYNNFSNKKLKKFEETLKQELLFCTNFYWFHEGVITVYHSW